MSREEPLPNPAASFSGEEEFNSPAVATNKNSEPQKRYETLSAFDVSESEAELSLPDETDESDYLEDIPENTVFSSLSDQSLIDESLEAFEKALEEELNDEDGLPRLIVHSQSESPIIESSLPNIPDLTEVDNTIISSSELPLTRRQIREAEKELLQIDEASLETAVEISIEESNETINDLDNEIIESTETGYADYNDSDFVNDEQYSRNSRKHPRDMTFDEAIEDGIETFSEKNVEDDESSNIIYKEERSLLRILLYIVGGFAGILVLLAIVGLIIGFSGGRPPTLDLEVLQNQLNDLMGKSPAPADPNDLGELTKRTS
jgi:hypothetical protein